MGLLTDPATGEGVFAHSLLRYSNKTSFLLYVLGVIWFALLAHDDITIGTHFSENALLPGLVKGDYSEDEIARGFLTELTNEMQNSSGQMPVPYLMARFHQLGLEGYIHNFTLHYPLGKPTENDCPASVSHADQYTQWTLKNPMDLYLQRLTTLVSMVATQATGVPNGNHGLFHRFGIEALTLEGVRSKKNIGGVRFFQMGKVIEGVFRSMNNLLERFHQSYFFYLMPASDRFVSISYYMPVLALLVSTVLLKAYSAWMILHAKYAAVMLNEKYTDKDKQDKIAGDKGKQDNKEESLAEELDESSLENLNLVRVGLIFLLTHGIGYLLIACVPFMTHYLEGPTDKALFLGIAGVSLATVLCTIVYKMLFSVGIDWSFYFIFCRVELGLATMCIGVQNFSLGLIIAVIYVLPAHYVSSTQNRWYNKVLWLLFHPLCILYFIILASTMFYFPELGLEALLSRSFQVTRTTLVYSAVDALIYGSWVYSICAGVILPIWLMFWVGLVLCRV
uniref:Glycosylphosphatidylinositol anchor attachment 1 protein n=1 Tax=Cacopsylla melanoneura TaxID=428564 RepID=A0A8D8VY61_9HEMI